MNPPPLAIGDVSIEMILPVDRNSAAGEHSNALTSSSWSYRGEDKRSRSWQDGAAMRQLLILRHAKSSWDDAAQPDRDRPLNARGRRTGAIMRQAMNDLHLAPDVVLVSTARRTLETLEALEPWDDAPLVEPMDNLYLANAVQLMAALHEVAETVRSVLLIGHNPGLHDLAVSLTGPRAIAAGGVTERRLAAGFPTAALAEFVIAGSWWELREGGGRLVRFLTPRMLGAAGCT
jgi:phosphohistidine phosphatase